MSLQTLGLRSMEQYNNIHLSFYPCLHPARRPLRTVMSNPSDVSVTSSCICLESLSRTYLHVKVKCLNTCMIVSRLNIWTIYSTAETISLFIK